MIDTTEQTATPEQIAAAYREVAASTKAASSNFYYAFITLPTDKRNAIYAGYTFCRLADDIVDNGEYGDSANEALDSLKAKLADTCNGKTDSNLWIALCDMFRHFQVNPEHLVAVVEGCRMDLNDTKYKTFENLTEYCERVASAVGLACIEVFGYDDDRAVEYAMNLGIGLQLTNILRDITEDLENGRVYVPADELAEYGITVDDLREKRVTPEFQEFMKFQVKRAREYMSSGEKLFPLLDKRSRSCPKTMSSVYSTLLDKIEENDYDVLNHRVSLSKFQKLRLLTVIWLRSRGLRFL